MKRLPLLVHGLITTCILFSMLTLSPIQSTLADTVMNADPADSKANQKPGKSAHVPDVLLLEVMPGITLDNNPGGGKDHKFTTNSPALDEALSSIGVLSLKPLFPPGQLKKEMPANLSRIYRLKLKPNTDVEAAVTALSLIPDVSYVEPDYIAKKADLPLSVNALTIDDPLYTEQWGMAKINIEGAWDDTYGSTTVTIAILDSGIDLTHIDLAGNLWINPGEGTGNNGLDDDSNGYVDDIRGWNFVSGNNDVSDEIGHGTLVAGVAAAIGGNAQGIVGVCPECTIMPVKVMQTSGTANYSDVAAGVLYAAEKGAEVINISLGGYANSNILSNAINAAVNTYGAVIVAGAGNDNLSTPFYPAYYANVLSVGGTQNDDTKVGTSNYGTWVDVSAPGIDIKTTALGGGWADNSGTSFASPFAAGLAGLLRTLHPTWNQATIRSQIVHTTDTIDSLNPTYAGKLGSGRLNAGRAMTAPHPLLSMAGYSVNGTPNGRPLLGATAQLTVTLSNDWWDATGVNATLSTTDISNVTIINGSASYGNIAAATSKTNSTPFTFLVASGAGNNHPIPFKLHLTDTTGYSIDIDLTVTTESGVVDKSGTIATQTWTNDKTYRITGSVNIPTGNTLTIQPGTTVKFNGNFALNVRGTLIADGTSSQPIQFKSNTAGTWDKIFFDDLNIDAQADVDGNYISGSILRYVNIEGNTGGVTCTTATPYLSHVNLKNGGISCELGDTPIWFLDDTVVGNVGFTGDGNAYRNTVSGGLGISGAGIAEDNDVTGVLSLGSGIGRRNNVGGLTIGGSGGSLENNTVSGGNVSLGDSFNVVGNSISGNLATGNGATVDHNTVSNGISVGSSATVTWNNVEGASGIGLTTGDNVTAQYNRLIGNATGMTATTGLIEHNLIANNMGVGLQVGAATVQYNTITGNKGNTIVVQDGNPLAIQYNNLEGNSGTYDLFVNIPNGGGVVVSSENNWWGTTDTIVIDTRIWDYWNDDTKATVNYLPILTEPDQTAPAFVRSVTVLPDATLGIQTGTFILHFSKPMDVNVIPQLLFKRSLGMTWTTRASMPTARGGLGVVAGTNGRIYAIGGYVHDPTDIVEEYDPLTDTWRTRASMPTARGDVGIAVASNGKIYVIGGVEYDIGSNPFTLATVEEYDPFTDTWRTRASMLTARSRLGVVAASNGRIYAIGGAAYPALFATVEEYDPATDTWTTRASMPTARDGLGVVAAKNGKIYAIGGGPDHDEFSTVEEYDPITNTWTTRASMPTARKGVGVAVDSYGIIYAIGGEYTDHDLQMVFTLGTLESYNPETDTWVTYSPRYACRSYLGATVSSNGKIYAVGGYWGEYPTNLLEEATPTFETSAFYNPQWLSETQYQAFYDITSIVPRDTYSVAISGATGADGIQIADNSTFTFTVDYTGSISDKTPPVKPTVIARGDSSLTTLSGSWFSNDPESPITKYRYAIGTTPGGRDVVAWTYTNDTSVTHTGLNLTSGVTYYISVGARNEGGLWSECGISNGIVAGVAPPGTFGKSIPANNSINRPINSTISWSPSTDITNYQYCLDKETTNNSTCNSSWVSAGTSTSVSLSGLSSYATYYWQVRASGGGGITEANGGVWWKFTTAKLSSTFYSTGTQDGHILESTETSIQGGTMNATGPTFYLGDAVGDKQYRAILSFNTAGLPDNSVITKVTLKIKVYGALVGNNNPIAWGAGLKMDICRNTFGTTSALQLTDFNFNNTTNCKLLAGTFGNTPALGWHSGNLVGTAWSKINKIGLTQFRLRFVKDDNDDGAADYWRFYSGNYATASARPVLIIEYYIP